MEKLFGPFFGSWGTTTTHRFFFGGKFWRVKVTFVCFKRTPLVCKEKNTTPKKKGGDPYRVEMS